MTQDPRDTFGDARLAHDSLRGQVESAAFTSGTLMRVRAPVADMRKSPDAPGLERQAIMGAPVRVLEPVAKSSLARNEDTGYVGWVNRADLMMWSTPTHRVQARASLLFTEPNFKAPNPTPVSCGAKLIIHGQEGRFSRTLDGLYAVTSHLAPLDRPEPDPVAVAQRLEGTPYLWGGDSSAGLDCSGLIGLALRSAGIDCPGDSDQQMAILGTTLPPNTPPKRGDLFFWKGHVAMATSATTLIHANAHALATVYEPIEDAIERIAAQGDGPVTAHKRL